MKRLKLSFLGLLSATALSLATLAGCGGGGGGAQVSNNLTNTGGTGVQFTVPGLDQVGARTGSKIPTGTQSLFFSLYYQYQYDNLAPSSSHGSDLYLTRSITIGSGPQVVAFSDMKAGLWSWNIYASSNSTNLQTPFENYRAYAKGSLMIKTGVVIDAPVVLGNFLGDTSITPTGQNSITYAPGDLITGYSHIFNYATGTANLSAAFNCQMPMSYDGWIGCPAGTGGFTFQNSSGSVSGQTSSPNQTGLGIYDTSLNPGQRLEAAVFGSGSVTRTISFGDGHSVSVTSTSQYIYHDYAAPGSYAVKVTPSTGEVVEALVTVSDEMRGQPGTVYAPLGYGFTNSGTLTRVQGDQAQMVVSASGNAVSIQFVGTAGATAGLGLHGNQISTAPTQSQCNSFNSYQSSLTLNAAESTAGATTWFCYRNGSTVQAYRVSFSRPSQTFGGVQIPAMVGLRAASFATTP